MSTYTESVSGFKRTGDWAEIIEHGERLAFALEELGADDEMLREYNEWRPKSTDNVSDDINDKTAEKAMTEKSNSKTATNDIKTAGEEIAKSYKNFGHPDDAFQNWIDSLSYAARAVDTVTRKSIRNVEKVVYKNVMTIISPYYFDNSLISANLARVDKDPQEYRLEINVNDDELKEDVSQKLESYEDDYNRWHISTDKNTETVDAAEGIEDSENIDSDELDPNPTST